MRRSGFKGLVAAGIVATGVVASTSAVAASDMFLKIGTIQGESLDAKHKGEIDVLSWSWGESTGTARTRRGVMPVMCIQDLALMKSVDSASPGLIMMGVTGQVVPEATLTVTKAGGSQHEYFILKMTNVSVSSFQTSGSAGGDDLTESVVLHFDSMRGEYRPQKPDGSLGVSIFFDVADTSRACR